MTTARGEPESQSFPLHRMTPRFEDVNHIKPSLAFEASRAGNSRRSAGAGAGGPSVAGIIQG
jgi:hypothetical protein